MQLVPVKNNEAGQLVPFAPTEPQKKKWSLTEWEDKRMRHPAGRIFVNVLYCLATLLLIICFIGLFTDIWKAQTEAEKKRKREIDIATANYKGLNCPNSLAPTDCARYETAMNQSESVGFGETIG